MNTRHITAVILLAISVACCRAGTCVNLNGLDGRVDIANSSSFNLIAPFTLEAWIRPDRLIGYQEIIYKWSGVDQRSFLLCISDDHLEIAFDPTGRRYDEVEPVSQGRVTLGEWTHVAGVHDGQRLMLFINGIRDSVIEATTLQPFVSSAPLIVGATPDAGNQNFCGGIDEVRISSVARYTQDFTPSRYEFVPDAHTRLLLHFNEGVGTTTANSGASGDGIFVGGVSWSNDSPVMVPEASSTCIALGLLALARRKHDRQSFGHGEQLKSA